MFDDANKGDALFLIQYLGYASNMALLANYGLHPLQRRKDLCVYKHPTLGNTHIRLVDLANMYSCGKMKMNTATTQETTPTLSSWPISTSPPRPARSQAATVHQHYARIRTTYSSMRYGTSVGTGPSLSAGISGSNMHILMARIRP